MDTLETYRAIIQNLLEEQAKIRYSYGNYRREIVFDREHDRYLMLATGWEGHKRIHHIVIQLDLCGGKIWIQENRTELNIDEELLAAGVPAEHIVIGLLSPSSRKYSDFAIA